MWILPKDIQHSFHSAQGSEVLSVELKELSQTFEQYVAWRGKLSSSKIWLRKWKAVWWLRVLFGRMLPTSQQNTFAEWWTYSQVAILARANLLPAKDLVKTIHVGYGDTSKGQLTLFSQISAPSDTIIYFNDRTWHQGVKAVNNGWRLFIRASRNTNRIATNELRNQVQVYLENPMEGW